MFGSTGDTRRVIAHDQRFGGTSRSVKGSWIALAGLLFSLLFLIGWLLVRESPSFNATDEELLAYYGDPAKRRDAVTAGLYVIPLACIAFIWFMAALRDRYVRTAIREHTILSTAHVVAGVLVVASLFTLAAVELGVAWLADNGEAFDVGGARGLLALGQASSDVMALRSAAVFVGVSASRAVRSGFFPRLYGVLSLLTAIALLLVFEAASWVTLLFPSWVAATSVLILVRRRSSDVVDSV
jgi:hypothetical protein